MTRPVNFRNLPDDIFGNMASMFTDDEKINIRRSTLNLGDVSDQDLDLSHRELTLSKVNRMAEQLLSYRYLSLNIIIENDDEIINPKIARKIIGLKIDDDSRIQDFQECPLRKLTMVNGSVIMGLSFPLLEELTISNSNSEGGKIDVEAHTNLRVLHLGDPSEDDVTLLKKIPNLEELVIHASSISHIPFIHVHRCQKLRHLELYNFRYLILSFLTKLPNLEVFKFINRIENGPDQRQVSLAGEKLREVIIRDINPLFLNFVGAPNLVKLHLTCESRQGEMVFGEDGTDKLEELKIKGFSLTNLVLLMNPTKLKKLHIQYCTLYNLDGLEEYKQLELLGIKFCRDLENITAISNLSNIRWFQMKKVKRVIDLQPLAGNKDLVFLDLSDTLLEDLGIVANFRKLTRLNIGDTFVSSLKPISKLTNITHLDISNTEIKNLSYLSELKNLVSLNASHCSRLRKLNPLENCKKLKELIVDYTSLVSLEGLESCKELKFVTCGNSELSDIRALENSTSLTNFYLKRSNINNLNILMSCPNLLNVELFGDKKIVVNPKLLIRVNITYHGEHSDKPLEGEILS